MASPLYQTKDRQIFPTDFVDALKAIGIQRGDTIFVHSDILTFGKLRIFERDILLKTLLDAFKESVGIDGTIVMPTFSYSFCKKEIYDIENTKSTVGALTEYFRKQPDVSRTAHPIFSVAIWGRQRKDLLDIGKDSFDESSVFGKLRRMGGKFVFFGAPFDSCTYIHYIEQLHGVPYRHIKTFRGKIRNRSGEYEDEYTYFVRGLDEEIVLDLPKVEKYLLEKSLMKATRLGYGRILMVESEILFKDGCRLLDQDIYFFLKKRPK